MLTCIACSKQLDQDAGEDERARGGAPSTKDAVKSLTSQIKEMVLKLSGAYRQCKPCTAAPSPSPSSGADCNGVGIGDGHRLPHPYHRQLDAPSEAAGGGVFGPYYQYQHLVLGRSSTASTPGWDFTSICAESADARFTNGAAPKARADAGPYEMVLEEDGEPKEYWMAQVEPGVHITFISLPGGGNDLKRIRFSRDMFNKWQAQRWWGENYDRITELYNVQRFSRQALPTAPRSEDERETSYRRLSARESPETPPPGKDRVTRNTNHHRGNVATVGKGVLLPVPDPTEHLLHYGGPGSYPPAINACLKGEASSLEASRTTTSSRDEAASISVSNGSDPETTEWVEQDDPGVYVTIRQLPDGSRELRRVRFSREQFSEKDAKQWWEENRQRIQVQYL